MKRFVFSAIYLMATFVAMTFVACNEFDEDLSRPIRTYEVVRDISGDLTDAESLALYNALIESNVDTSVWLIQTDNITMVASQIEERLKESVSTAMMIGFKAQGHGQEDRYAARIIIGNYGQ